jgi:hypothetical protein
MIACLEGGAGAESCTGGVDAGTSSRGQASSDRWETPAWAARFRFHPEAPHPSEFLGALDDRRIAELLGRKREARACAIAQLQAELRSRGMPAERIVAAIMYDGEHAPKSTNRAQLGLMGVDVPRSPDAIAALDADDCARELWRVIYGLACLGIFLIGTDHLDDRRLLTFLAVRVLEEEIHDVPPIEEMSEFIDLGAVSPAGEVFVLLGGGMNGDDSSAASEVEEHPADGAGIEVEPAPLLADPDSPMVSAMVFPRVVRRDDLLPRPDRGDGAALARQSEGAS